MQGFRALWALCQPAEPATSNTTVSPEPRNISSGRLLGLQEFPAHIAEDVRMLRHVKALQVKAQVTGEGPQIFISNVIAKILA